MWHPLHPQRTNYLTLISYKNSLLVTICKILPSTTQLFSTPPPFMFPPILPSDQSHYFLWCKVRPLARPARRTSNGDWSLTRATSSATLNKWTGWFTDPATSGSWGESDSKRSLFPGTALSPRLCRSPNPFTVLSSRFRDRRPTRV
jgi:hypothetical protein